MREQIERKLRQIPEAPGVYRMLDAEGHVIYIGKSKCLKKRVHSYFVPNPKWEKAEKMVRFIHDLEYTVTDTHLDAKLLECALIKEVRPYFNVLMKNEQKYMYLKVGEGPRKPVLRLVSEKEENSFGPLRSRRIAEDLILSMRNLYPITKEKTTYEFEYHILPVEMDRETFAGNRALLLELCSRPKAIEKFIRRLERFMKLAAGEQKFELAMRYRDLVQGWSYVKKELNNYEELMKQDVIYSVPTGKDYKYFYISRGMVLHTCKKSVQSEEAAASYGAEVREMLEKAARGEGCLPKTETYLEVRISEKSAVDYRAIVYGELGDMENGAALIAVGALSSEIKLSNDGQKS